MRSALEKSVPFRNCIESHGTACVPYSNNIPRSVDLVQLSKNHFRRTILAHQHSRAKLHDQHHYLHTMR